LDAGEDEMRPAVAGVAEKYRMKNNRDEIIVGSSE